MKQGWEYKKIGNICNITTGKLDANAANEDGLYPFFTCSRIPLSINTYAYDCECILIAGNGDLNVKYYNGKFNAYQRTYILQLKNDVNGVEMRYIFAFFNLYIEELRRKSIGGIIKYIKLGDLTNALLPLPDITTQLSIVSELDKINELIRLKKEQLKDYDNLAQSIFYEMFGDPVENEKGWEVKKWKEVFNTILGKMLDKSKQINHLKQYKYLANMNVQWGYFDLKELRSMTFTDEELAKYELRNNDLLICEGGDAGRCAIWKETDETILFQKAIHRARLIDTDNADVVYIRYWMQFYKVNKGLKDYISKSTIEHLTGDKLKRLPIPLPPLPLQHLFAQRIEQIERQKSAVQQSITDLETLLASRMQYWFE